MDNPFYGMLQAFGFNFAPLNYAFCQGQLLDITQHTALFSLLGTIYGGNGTTSFGLPNLMGRAAAGQGGRPGAPSYPIGASAGAETASLTILNLPPHNHSAHFQPTGGSASVAVSTTAGAVSTPSEGVYAGGGGLTAAQPNYVPPASAGTTVPLGGVTPAQTDGAVTLSPTGANVPINVVQPVLAISWCIALQGLYPSRN
ncbi:MAG: tail fiber protein [Marivibrio sp.]|uniref:phage tail protein n=1 Tax=Marivibrio sp. TaxID=2039719 RepID=UPI0032EDE668